MTFHIILLSVAALCIGANLRQLYLWRQQAKRINKFRKTLRTGQMVLVDGMEGPQVVWQPRPHEGKVVIRELAKENHYPTVALDCIWPIEDPDFEIVFENCDE